MPPDDVPKGSPVFGLDLLDQDGKPLLQLEELGVKEKVKGKGKDKAKDKDNDWLAVRIREGKTAATVLIPREPFSPVAGRNAPADGGCRTSRAVRR